MTCAQCSKSLATKNPMRPLKGSKRFKGALYCGACWRERYRLTAAIIPVAEPLSGTWDEFGIAMRSAWAETTGCCNWMMTELYVRDCRRGGEAKMPPMAKQYLYPEARRRFPNLTAQSVASLEQAVTAKYRAKRYEIVWTASSSLPAFRYPTPFPVHNQSWSVEMEAGKPVVSARIGDARWRLRLKAGPPFRRQLAVIHSLLSGDAMAGELAIYKHHDGTVLVKIVAWIPRQVLVASAGILFVRTGITHFLTAQLSTDPDDEAWFLNADDVRRAIREYDRKLERLRQDRKAEQRPIPTFAARQEIIVAKQRRRMRSRVQEIAAQVVNYAKRRRAARLEYTDRVRHEEGFPWFVLAQRIGQKCNEYGIEFVHHASAEVATAEAEPLATEETQ